MRRSERAKYLLRGLEKAEPVTDQTHTPPNKHTGEAQKRSISGKVQVEGQIEVHLPPSKQQKGGTTKEEHRTRELVKVWIEGFGLLAVIIYAGLTYWQASTTQKIFDAGNRPYVGPNGGIISTLVNQADNKPFGMKIKSQVKNFGTAPGEDFSFTWEVRIDGNKIATDPKHGVPYTLFPGEVANLDGTIKGPTFYDLESGKTILQINLIIRYRNGKNRYDYCERQQYDAAYHDMLSMGPTCDAPWAKGPIPPPAAMGGTYSLLP
jgi:hypothetical protein